MDEKIEKNNIDAIPLINAFTPILRTTEVRNSKWSDNAIAHFFVTETICKTQEL